MNDFSYYLPEVFAGLTGIALVTAIVTLCFVALFALAVYVMRGIALLKMAKRTGVRHGWMGFVPFADMWLIGRLSDVGTNRRSSAPLLLSLGIANAVCSAILNFGQQLSFSRLFMGGFQAYISVSLFGLGFYWVYLGVSIAQTVFLFMAYFRICRNFSPLSYGGWFAGIVACSFLVPIGVWVLFLILSYKTPMYRSIEA